MIYVVQEVALGEYLVRDLPGDTLKFIAVVNDRRYEQHHDATVPELRITVPATGAVEAIVELPADRPPSERIYVSLLDAESLHLVRAAELPAGSSGTTMLRIDGVLPGDYRAVLRSLDTKTAKQEWNTLTHPTEPTTVHVSETNIIRVGAELWMD
jgi:hypothetical protein